MPSLNKFQEKVILDICIEKKSYVFDGGKKDITFFDQEPQKFDQEEKLDLQKKNTEP